MAAPRLAFSAAHLGRLRAAPLMKNQPAFRNLAAFHSARVLSVQPSKKVEVAPTPKALVAADADSYVKGTVNDPTPFPPSSKAHGSIHWTFERVLSAALIPVTAATAVVSANPVLDGVLGVALIFHSHLGFDNILQDYVHKGKFPTLAPIASWAVRLLTVGTLVGVYSFNTNDIGLTELIKKLWKA